MKIDIYFNKKLWTFFYTDEDLIISIKDRYFLIEKGFISDGGSIPRIFWRILNPLDGRFLKSYIKHDYIYENKLCKRRDADIELLNDLINNGMNTFLACCVFVSVRIFGFTHY